VTEANTLDTANMRTEKLKPYTCIFEIYGVGDQAESGVVIPKFLHRESESIMEVPNWCLILL
jgi:hypothetical protein